VVTLWIKTQKSISTNHGVAKYTGSVIETRYMGQVKKIHRHKYLAW